jgi:PBP1b-binding outer membrane lipoprotein LpoB
MKKLALSIIAVALFLAGCANVNQMTPEEREAIRRSNQRYEAGQRP